MDTQSPLVINLKTAKTRWEHEHLLEAAQRRLNQNPQAMRLRRETVEHPFGTVRGGDKVFHWSGGDLQSRRSKIQPVVRRSFVLWTKGRRRDVCRGGLRGGSAICFQ
jgi:hypothetical protein